MYDTLEVRLERWACVNLMEFSKAKCKVLQLGQGNAKLNTGWVVSRLRAALRGRTWEYWWMKNSA